MKKIISIILLCSTLVSLAACSSQAPEKENTETTDVQTDTPIKETSDMPYYGEKTVNILTQTRNSYEANWIIDEICVEDLTGDSVNDAIYYRNAAVEELLGIEIKQTVKNDNNSLEKTVNSGDTVFDIVALPSDIGVQFIQDGLMHDLYGNGIEKYLNTESPWWSQYWIDEAEINGHLYCITGAPSLSLSRFTMVMFYNKGMGRRLNLEDPYEVVNSGRWTIDYVNKIIAGLYHDRDKDGAVNGNDIFGITLNPQENGDMFWSAFDMSLLKKGDDGWYIFDTAEKEKISTAFDKIFSLINKNPDSYDVIDRVGLDDSRDWFALDRVLLTPLHLRYAESQTFRYTDVDYAVLPLPKYDEAQDDYYTFVQEQYSIFMIPKAASDPEMSGAVLEAMARESYKSLQPVYYDSILKGKYTRDEQTKQMIDKISTNVKLDAAWIYGALWNKPATTIFSDLIDKGDKNFDAKYANQERIMKILLKEFKSKFEAVIANS